VSRTGLRRQTRLVGAVAAENLPASITFDMLQGRKDLVVQQCLVRVGILLAGPTSPMACDHSPLPSVDRTPFDRMQFASV